MYFPFQGKIVMEDRLLYAGTSLGNVKKNKVLKVITKTESTVHTSLLYAHYISQNVVV